MIHKLRVQAEWRTNMTNKEKAFTNNDIKLRNI